MKTLDLNAYGVSEMHVAEMKATDGGTPVVLFIVGLLLGIVFGAMIVGSRE